MCGYSFLVYICFSSWKKTRVYSTFVCGEKKINIMDSSNCSSLKTTMIEYYMQKDLKQKSYSDVQCPTLTVYTRHHAAPLTVYSQSGLLPSGFMMSLTELGNRKGTQAQLL